MDLIERFEREYLEYNQISRGRQQESLKVLREFEASLGGRSLAQATADDFAAYLAQLTKRYHVNTVRKQGNMIRAYFNWGFSRRLYTADTLLGVKAVKNPRGASGRTNPRPYTRTQVRAFWRELDYRYPLMSPERYTRMIGRYFRGTSRASRLYRHGMHLQLEAIVRLALDCGLRRSEIFGLKPDDLHYDNAYLVIRGKADPTTGKPKYRRVPFTGTAREAVKAWLHHRTLLLRPSHDSTWVSLWPTALGKPMWESRFQHLLNEAMGGWELHRFRHTCATAWLRAGMPLERVQELLGHATINQTLAYAEVATEDVEASMEKHGRQFEEQVGRDPDDEEEAA